MYFLINNKNKIIFGYSAKAGCSHVKYIFNYYNDIGYIKNLKNLHIQTCGRALPKNHKDYKIILFIRNPYKRIVSGFIEKYCKSKWKTNIKPLTFENFVNDLDKNGLMNIETRHFECQLSIKYEKTITFYKIFDIENIDYTYLDKLFKKKLPSNFYIIKGSHETKYSNISKKVYNLEYKYFSTKIPIYTYFYNEDIKNKVIKFYKKDFEFFELYSFIYSLDI